MTLSILFFTFLTLILLNGLAWITASDHISAAQHKPEWLNGADLFAVGIFWTLGCTIFLIFNIISI